MSYNGVRQSQQRHVIFFVHFQILVSHWCWFWTLRASNTNPKVEFIVAELFNHMCGSNKKRFPVQAEKCRRGDISNWGAFYDKNLTFFSDRVKIRSEDGNTRSPNKLINARLDCLGKLEFRVIGVLHTVVLSWPKSRRGCPEPSFPKSSGVIITYRSSFLTRLRKPETAIAVRTSR